LTNRRWGFVVPKSRSSTRLLSTIEEAATPATDNKETYEFTVCE
jgi:hypothetical protein